MQNQNKDAQLKQKEIGIPDRMGGYAEKTFAVEQLKFFRRSFTKKSVIQAAQSRRLHITEKTMRLNAARQCSWNNHHRHHYATRVLTDPCKRATP